MTTHDRYSWQRLAESLLTLFVVLIFCLSAYQLVNFTVNEMRTAPQERAAMNDARLPHMWLSRALVNLEAVLMAYHLGQSDIQWAQVQTQAQYLRTVLAQTSMRVAIGDDGTVLQGHILGNLENVLRYTEPVYKGGPQDIADFVGDVDDLRQATQDMIVHINSRYMSDENHTGEQDFMFLIYSIVSMAVAGLGLIALLLLKLRAADRLLREREALSRKLSVRMAAMEAAGDGIAIVGGEGRLVYANRAMRDLYGMAEDGTGTAWSPLSEPEQAMAIMRVRGYWAGEAVIARADDRGGDHINAEISLTTLPDGGYIATARDVTARKEAAREKEDILRQFYQAQKMEAVGRLAGGIAHDFNNILASMIGYTEFILEDTDKDNAVHGYARQIYSGATQARTLVDQILAFSRRSEGGMAPLSLTDTVRQMAGMLRSMVPLTLTMKIDDDGGENIISGNASQIGQALMNLCVNAIDAMAATMKGGNDPVLSVDCRAVIAKMPDVWPVMLRAPLSYTDEAVATHIWTNDDGTHCLQSGYLQEGHHYVVVTVQDNGSGMSREVIEKIFEPFFSTKSADRGTGLGLSAVQGIVDAHHGAMAVASKAGSGTVFRLYFPLSAAADARGSSGFLTAVQGQENTVMQGSGNILVVDDQPDVAAIAGEMLTRMGYEVDLVAGADMAVDFLRERPGYYHLILTDYAMPDATGLELARTVRDDFPDLPVIIMTGYAQRKLDWEDNSCPNIVATIRKPLDRILLSQIIVRALQNGHGE